jgi:hypothetical protein
MPKITKADLDRIITLVNDAIDLQDEIREAMAGDPDWNDYDDFTAALSEETEAAVHLKRLRDKLGAGRSKQ